MVGRTTYIATAASPQGKSKYRRMLRKKLGPDDPIITAFNAVVQHSKNRKIGDASKAHWLGDNDKPISPEWADKIAQGQRRSHESGKRKPLPPDQGTRVSLGKRKG